MLPPRSNPMSEPPGLRPQTLVGSSATAVDVALTASVIACSVCLVPSTSAMTVARTSGVGSGDGAGVGVGASAVGTGVGVGVGVGTNAATVAATAAAAVA